MLFSFGLKNRSDLHRLTVSSSTTGLRPCSLLLGALCHTGQAEGSGSKVVRVAAAALESSRVIINAAALYNGCVSHIEPRLMGRKPP